FVMGYAYREFALESPQRYRLMFGLASPQLFHLPTAGMPVGDIAFDHLVTVVRRIVATGRIREDDTVDLAGRIWSAIHGVVLLEIGGYFGHDGRALTHILGPMTVDMFVGMGDDRGNAEASLQRARAAIADQRRSSNSSR